MIASINSIAFLLVDGKKKVRQNMSDEQHHVFCFFHIEVVPLYLSSRALIDMHGPGTYGSHSKHTS